MKLISLDKAKELAYYHGGNLIIYDLPAIDFGDYGFEATEIYDDKYACWQYYGDQDLQDLLQDLWEDLTETEVNKAAFTIQLAKQLIGKKVRLSYFDMNEGEYIILIKGIKEVAQKQLGQDTMMKLIFQQEIGGVLNDSYEDWIYEWQDIFRRGNGAEKLYLEQVY